MGGKSGGDQTIGFSYYMSVHMGLCRGPIDEVVRINAGDVPMWPYADGSQTLSEAGSESVFKFPSVPALEFLYDFLGNILEPEEAEVDADAVYLLTTATGPGGVGIQQFSNGGYAVVGAEEIVTISATGDYAIDAPELFGGEKKEGGIAGSLRAMFGAATQTVPEWIKALMGGRVPAFRGVATLFFDGMLTAMNPYPKKWEFRVRRTESGWDGDVWQPGLVTIWMRDGTIKAMNGAHILYECFTNRDWGRGMPRDSLLEATWLKVAETLYNERFGLCLRYTRQSELSEFIMEVLDHIGGAIYPDPATGRIALSLLRGDYDADDLPVFTYDTGLIQIEESDTVSQDDVVNEVIVNWHDPIENEDRSSRVQNNAARQAAGAVNSNTVSYSGAPTSELSLKLAQRDIKANAAVLKRYKIVLDRRASRMAPASVFRISAPDMGIYNAVLRAGKITHGRAGDGRITVEATLDVYGLPSATFVTPETPNWVPASRNAQAVVHRLVREATYAELVRTVDPANLAILENDASAVAVVAAKPTNLSLAYEVLTQADGETKWTRGPGTFTPYVVAAADIPVEASSVIPFVGAVDMGLVEIGATVQIGSELGRLDDIEYDSTTGSGTITVARGCVDSVPQAHADGERIFFITDELGSDGRQFVSGEEVDVKLLTYTSSNKLKRAAAPTDTLTFVGRQGRPYPPGNVKVNGMPFYEPQTVTADVSVTWAHRNRVTQQDQLVAHDAGSIAAEGGTTYRLRVYDGDTATLLRTVTGITGVEFIYTEAMMSADGLTTDPWFELESVRDGLTSTQGYRFGVDVS